MNGFARLLLVATSLAPALLVAGAGWWVSARELAITCIIVAVLLGALCLLLLRAMRSLSAAEVLRIDKATRSDKNVFPFLFAYVVPLLVPTTLSSLQQGTNALGLLAFILVMFAVLHGTKLHDVNPVLGVFGYHFFEVEAGALGGVLLLTKEPKAVANAKIHAIRLSDYLWLEKDRPTSKDTDTGAPESGGARERGGTVSAGAADDDAAEKKPAPKTATSKRSAKHAKGKKDAEEEADD